MRSSKTKEIPIHQLHLDPKRFQFRTSAPKEGKGLNLKRVISVWHDPKQKKMFVVNGHHTVSAAKNKLASHSFKAHHIKAHSSDEARMTGALQNIVEGDASPEDTDWMIGEIESQPADVQKRIMDETDAYLKLSKQHMPKGTAATRTLSGGHLPRFSIGNKLSSALR